MTDHDPTIEELQDIENQLDVGHKVSRNQRILLWLAIAGLVMTIILNFAIARAAMGRFPTKEYLYTQNAASVCNFANTDVAGKVTQSQIRNLAANIAVGLNSYSYADWRTNIDRVTAQYFTPTARAAYSKTLYENPVLRETLNGKYVVVSTVADLPFVESEGLNENNAYAWRVVVPITVAYARDNEYRPENRNITLTFERTAVTATNPLGVLVTAVSSTQRMLEEDTK